MPSATLRGLTWAHRRGYGPLLAAAEPFAAVEPDVEVRWETRSLQQFADQPLSRVAKSFDLIVFDHPFIGRIAQERLLLPLDDVLDEQWLRTLAAESVGPSYASYAWDGHQWAVPIDAACHVSAVRPDTIAATALPATWPEVLDLGRELRRSGRHLGMPLYPVDAFNTFLTLCADLGDDPFTAIDHVVRPETGHRALGLLEALHELAQPGCLETDPIELLDAMSTGDDVVYAPVVFAYVTYSRDTDRGHRLSFGPLPTFGDPPGRGILGGAGLGISPATRERSAAASFLMVVAGGDYQRDGYADAGGQPSHAHAWNDSRLDERSMGFYSGIRATLERAYVRPRYDGFVEFHTAASAVVHRHLAGHLPAARTLELLDALYRASRGTRVARDR